MQTECPLCFAYVPEGSLSFHIEHKCEGRIVRCRMVGCKARFPACDREEHEREYCIVLTRRRRLVRSRDEQWSRFATCEKCGRTDIAEIDLQMHIKAECPKREIPCRDCRALVAADEMKAHSRSCPVKRRRRELAEASKRGDVVVSCEKCNESMAQKHIQKHMSSSCPFRPVRCRFFGCEATFPYRDRERHEREDCTASKRREEMIESWNNRETSVTCPQCGDELEVVDGQRLKDTIRTHMERTCRKRLTSCPNYGCDCMLFPFDVNFHTLRGKRDPCFLCKRLDLAKPYIFRSRDRLQSVDIDKSKGVVPSNTFDQLTLLADLLSQHTKLRKRVVRTFQRDNKAICALREVQGLFENRDYRKMDETDWNDLIEAVRGSAETLSICSRAGGRGDVVTKTLFVCSRCFEDDKIPPLTTKDQYDRLDVCKIAFRRQFLLHQKSEMDQLIPCPNGCGETFQKRAMRRHVTSICPRRMVKCPRPGCNISFPLSERKTHDARCKAAYHTDSMAMKARAREEIKSCAFKCGFRGTFQRVKTHEMSECARRMICCDNKGCEVWVPFEELLAHKMVCQAHAARKERTMDGNAWSRNLKTHPDLLGYWKQKVRLRKGMVSRLSEQKADAIDTLRSELEGMCLPCE